MSMMLDALAQGVGRIRPPVLADDDGPAAGIRPGASRPGAAAGSSRRDPVAMRVMSAGTAVPQEVPA